MNAAWHSRHPMPKNATLAQRITWHRAHQKHCACPPVPRSIAHALDAPRAPKARSKSEQTEIDPRFAKLVAAFQSDSRVTYGGKGFGSTALKVDGKIFAMLTPRGEFVVKLSAARVNELVARGTGAHFEPGPGRVMKEWLSVKSKRPSWLALAREARAAAE